MKKIFLYLAFICVTAVSAGKGFCVTPPHTPPKDSNQNHHPQSQPHKPRYHTRLRVLEEKTFLQA